MRASAGTASRHRRHQAGFTITELAIVGTTVGILATMAAPTWMRVRSDTLGMLCIQNQKKVYEAVCLYEFATGSLLDSIRNNGSAIRDTLMDAGYIDRQMIFECPSSQVKDYDDYRLVYEAGQLKGTVCSVLPDLHVPTF